MIAPLLDLGNVVVRVDFHPFLAWLREKSGCSRERAHGVLSSQLFFDYEFGNISREQFFGRLGEEYGATFALAEGEEKFCSIFPGPVDGIGDWLAELASAGPVYALSNTNELHLEWLWKTHPGLMRVFRQVFASHELRARKPDPGIYRGVARSLGLAPEGLVFFDDLPANVHGAKQAGLQAHLFTDTAGARTVLKRK